ncbi:CP2 transcription factor-domain-containing protein [Alternaria rosae]|uniref:CP2 transcription factor-domain-containing protein n=1 Tax=Alternaria rosae TaxID=1187941 RepID=UPI001E8E283D|nr:CP2 transcription factor-domain-containing protein [Alternaria rosae]KAH6873108.1 CP2 transcription factor-domain-containing protein [Alternaria rosae]
MFRNRLNSQKPDGKLLEDFKATFPHLQQRSHSLAGTPGHTLADALDVAHPSRQLDHEDIKDQDPTPRGNNEPWRFTPSLLDPNSFAFTSFANQPPGYYTPTPGGTNTLYHSQAGDLHTPGFSFGLGTPLSLPTSEGALHAGQVAPANHLHGFNPHALGSHHFQNVNPFGMQTQHSQSFAPHQFTHQPSAFDQGNMTQTHQDSSMDNMVPEVEMQEQSPLIGYAPHSYDGMAAAVAPAPPPPNQNFRYHVTLNAPTAMIKQSDEVPVTYLNKGQAYSISLVDTAPTQAPSPSTKYRTFIRISFEDEQQRQRPASCWQLWKEGRGTNEAHQRGGRLQAVEFVDPSQVSGGEIQGRPRVELESSSFDGFVVTWTPTHNSSPECSLAVRFNFLSTDFSHSKGVKGIPVRLCAKTEMVTEATGSSPQKPDGELCYCKVKLFRDHGAERKLSNDVAHVKKTIDKLKQQIAQVESGMKDFGKRKRSGSISKGSMSQRPGKVPKHKRTWSMSSTSDNQGGRAPAEEDLHIKLASLQDMFSSTRPVSVLYLKGEEQDDPDLHPVILGATPQELSKLDTNVDAPMWEAPESQTAASSAVSPTPSSQSLHSEKRRTTSFQRPAPYQPPSRMSSNEWRSMPQTATGDLKGMHGIQGGADVPTKVQRPYSDDHALSGWIEALGVDQTYQPPPEPMLKPVACFFVQPRLAGRQPDDNYFRAVYLMERTVKELVASIAMKIKIEPTKVTRTIRVNQKGLQILMDDDAVNRIPEQQDMTAEFHEIGTPPVHAMKREWDAGPTDIQVDGDISVTENVHSTGYELRLLF